MWPFKKKKRSECSYIATVCCVCGEEIKVEMQCHKCVYRVYCLGHETPVCVGSHIKFFCDKHNLKDWLEQEEKKW